LVVKRPVGLTSMSHVGHNSDVSPWSLYVCCWGQSGKHVLAASISEIDPGCVKTRFSGGCAELFSQLASRNKGCQCN
jgi:hypothetical protein